MHEKRISRTYGVPKKEQKDKSVEMVRIKYKRDEEAETLTTDVDVLKERFDDVEKLKTS